MVALTCFSSTLCFAGDSSGYAVKYTGSWGSPADIDSTRGIRSISCAATTLCVAVGDAGYAVTYNGSSWAASTDADAARGLKAVSCTSTTLCIAVDNAGTEVTLNGTSWGTPQDIDASNALEALSCPSSTFCEAIDSTGNALQLIGTSWQAPTGIDATRTGSAISCPSTTFCVAADTAGYAVQYQNVPPAVSQLTWDTNGSESLILSDAAYDYIYGPNATPVEQVSLSTSTPTFLTFTPSDSTWLATNAQGDATAFYGYDAFGNLAFGTPASPFGYAGQYTDASSGFSNLRARCYVPRTGTFATRDPAFGSTDTAYTYAGGDPVNVVDPLGLWGWNPISDVSQAAGDVGHYVITHKKGIEVGVSIGLGVLAAGTGFGALVEGSVLLASVSVAAGLGASALDYGPCVNGNDTAACVGLGLGLTGAVTGAFGLAGAGLVAAEIIAEDSTAAAILGGLGAFGWNVGIAGTIIDATTGIASASSLCSTTK